LELAEQIKARLSIVSVEEDLPRHAEVMQEVTKTARTPAWRRIPSELRAVPSGARYAARRAVWNAARGDPRSGLTDVCGVP
jgi:hypothetical protein